MYEEIGKVSDATIAQLKVMLSYATWEVHTSDVTKHQAASCMEPLKSVSEIVKRWPIETWDNPSFLRLGPNGKLYRHADEGYGFHIPIETNDEVVSLSYENGVKKEDNLEVGKIYLVDRSIEHESFNYGDTDRTHLIMLLKEGRIQ